VAANTDHTREIRDLAGGTVRLGFAAHGGVVEDAAPAPEGTTMASAGVDGAVNLWDARTGKPVWRFEGTQARFSGTFSPDGRYVLDRR
jgi:WD40 repeat protein